MSKWWKLNQFVTLCNWKMLDNHLFFQKSSLVYRKDSCGVVKQIMYNMITLIYGIFKWVWSSKQVRYQVSFIFYLLSLKFWTVFWFFRLFLTFKFKAKLFKYICECKNFFYRSVVLTSSLNATKRSPLYHCFHLCER